MSPSTIALFASIIISAGILFLGAFICYIITELAGRNHDRYYGICFFAIWFIMGICAVLIALTYPFITDLIQGGN